MRKIIPIVFCCLMISGQTAEAQYKDTSLKYDFPQFWKETGRYFTTPLHWNGTDFLMIGSLAVGTAITYAFELPATPVVPGTNSYLPRPLYNGVLAKFGDFYGGLWTPFIF